MAKLEIILHEKGGDVKYSTHHVSGQKYIDLLDMQISFEKNDALISVDVIQQRLEFTAGLFEDEAVSAKSILTGTDPWDLIPTLDRLQRIILGADDDDSKKEELLLEK